jgi:hypothetical protein
MNLERDDQIDPVSGELAPYLALDRLLRYARSEALSQHRQKAASLIEAAIISLSDTDILSKH